MFWIPSARHRSACPILLLHSIAWDMRWILGRPHFDISLRYRREGNGVRTASHAARFHLLLITRLRPRVLYPRRGVELHSRKRGTPYPESVIGGRIAPSAYAVRCRRKF